MIKPLSSAVPSGRVIAPPGGTLKTSLTSNALGNFTRIFTVSDLSQITCAGKLSPWILVSGMYTDLTGEPNHLVHTTRSLDKGIWKTDPKLSWLMLQEHLVLGCRCRTCWSRTALWWRQCPAELASLPAYHTCSAIWILERFEKDFPRKPSLEPSRSGNFMLTSLAANMEE